MGKDSDKTDAIKTYEDYKNVYKLGNIINDSSDSVEFNNKFETTQYLENIIGKNLTDKITTTCYQMTGTCLIKNQIKDWIKSTSDTEYDYNGYRWSKIRKVDNISDMQLLQKDENKNIIKYKPAKNSYWLNYDSKVWLVFLVHNKLKINIKTPFIIMNGVFILALIIYFTILLF